MAEEGRRKDRRKEGEREAGSEGRKAGSREKGAWTFLSVHLSQVMPSRQSG